MLRTAIQHLFGRHDSVFDSKPRRSLFSIQKKNIGTKTQYRFAAELSFGPYDSALLIARTCTYQNITITTCTNPVRYQQPRGIVNYQGHFVRNIYTLLYNIMVFIVSWMYSKSLDMVHLIMWFLKRKLLTLYVGTFKSSKDWNKFLVQPHGWPCR